MKRILIILGVLAVIIVGALAYGGMFTTAVVTETEEGPYLLMGIEHKGAYKDIGPVFQKMEQLAKEKQVAGTAYAGVYFDDPQTVAEAELKSIAAVVVQSADDSLKLSTIEGIRVYPIEKGKAIVCDRNTSNTLEMIISVMKAYPAIKSYMDSHPEYQQGVKHVYELYKEEKQTRFVFQY